MSYKFETKKYLTKGIDHKIPIQVQIYLWKLIADLLQQQVDLDYLQIFTIKKKGKILEITHSQEQPTEFEVEYKLVEESIKNLEDMEIKDTKIYVIDNKDHCIMLLASEY